MLDFPLPFRPVIALKWGSNLKRETRKRGRGVSNVILWEGRAHGRGRGGMGEVSFKDRRSSI